MIYILVILTLIAWGGIEQPVELDKKYTKDKFLALRALLAMQVVFGHTFPNNAYKISILDKLLLPFNNTGFLCVSLFFFLSGYGVYESSKKREDYFEHFFSKKIITILIPYWTINLLYIIAELLSNKSVNIKSLILSFIWPVYNRAAWYVFAILVIYCFMYFSIGLLKLKNKKMYFMMATLLSIYTIVFFTLKVGSQWYVSIFAVLFGIVFSDYKDKILLRIHLIPKVLLFFILYIGMLWGNNYIPGVGIIGIKMILSVVTPLIVVKIMEKQRIGNKWLDSIGLVSYEIYLVQGLFVQYLHFPSAPSYLKEFAALINVFLSVVVGYWVSKPIGHVLQILRKRVSVKS